MRLNFGKGSLIGALFLASIISNVDSSCKKINGSSENEAITTTESAPSYLIQCTGKKKEWCSVMCIGCSWFYSTRTPTGGDILYMDLVCANCGARNTFP